MGLPPALAVLRPNALDREVDALSTHALLTRSAFDLIDAARAAAAAWLQTLLIPAWLVMVLVQIAVLAWFWRSGSAARLRDRLRLHLRNEFFVRFAFGAVVVLLAYAAALIPQVFQYRVVRIMQLTDQLLRTWLLGWVESTIIAMLVAGTIAAVVLWMADRTHQWYLYTIAAVIGFTLLFAYVNPYVVTPISPTTRPAALPPAVAADVRRLRRLTGGSAAPILQDASRQTPIGYAYVTGWGRSQRIIISKTLIAGSTPAEVLFVIARSLGSIQANDGLHEALIESAFIVLGTALAVFIADRVGFRRDDDPLSRLALVGALMGAVYLVGVPFYNGYLRQRDVDAQAYAVGLTGDRAAAIRYWVRDANQALLPICPQPVAHWYLDVRPAPGSTIAELQQRPDPCNRASNRR